MACHEQEISWGPDMTLAIQTGRARKPSDLVDIFRRMIVNFVSDKVAPSRSRAFRAGHPAAYARKSLQSKRVLFLCSICLPFLIPRMGGEVKKRAISNWLTMLLVT